MAYVAKRHRLGSIPDNSHDIRLKMPKRLERWHGINPDGVASARIQLSVHGGGAV